MELSLIGQDESGVPREISGILQHQRQKRRIVQNGIEGRRNSGRFCRKDLIQCAKSWTDEHGVRCAQDNPASWD